MPEKTSYTMLHNALDSFYYDDIPSYYGLRSNSITDRTYNTAKRLIDFIPIDKEYPKIWFEDNDETIEIEFMWYKKDITYVLYVNNEYVGWVYNNFT